MELRQLDHFVAVAEEGSFTRAAKRMNIVQSGLSMSIRSLEDELGTKLFARGTKGVALTPAGESMLAEARRAIAAVRAVRDAVDATEGLKRGNLAVGLAQYSLGDQLPNLLTRFHAEYPAVCIKAAQGKPSELLAQVAAEAIDLVICGKPQDVPAGVTTIQLARAPYVLACANDHPIASRRRVSLADVAGERFIELHPGWVTRQMTDQAFALAGISRNVVCEVDDVYLRLKMVEGGLGVAILPKLKIAGADAVTYVPLAASLPEWQLVAAYSGTEPANPAARVFLAMATREWLG